MIFPKMTSLHGIINETDIEKRLRRMERYMTVNHPKHIKFIYLCCTPSQDSARKVII